MTRTRLLCGLLVIGGVWANRPLPSLADGAADALIAAAKQASGGAAWDKITSWHERGAVRAGGLTGTYEGWVDFVKLREASSYQLGPTSGGSGWDGAKAWTTDASRQVRIETSGEAVAQAIQDSYRGGYAFFFPGRYPAGRQAAGKRSADARSFDAVRITPKGAEPFEIWFDPQTHLIDRIVQLSGAQPHSYINSDWRVVDGITLPFAQIDRVGGDPKYDIVANAVSIELSTPIPDSGFQPPAPPLDDTIWPAGQSSVSVPFRLLNNHIYVEASINGKPAAPFVFDTGATNIIDASAAKQLGIKVEGALPGGGFGDNIATFGLARVASVSIGGLAIPHQVFGTEDAPGWVKVEGAASSGLLGYEFAKRAVLTVDYAARRMTFTKPRSYQPPAGVTAIPFTFDAHIPMVKATIDGIPGEFEIDTGSRGALTLMHPFAIANKLIERCHAVRLATAGYGVGGPSRVLLGRAETFAIGPVVLDNPVAEITLDARGAAAETRTAGNIGGDLLKRFTVTLDYAHQQLWLQPNPLAGEPEVFDRSGLWISRAADGSIAIDDVAKDGAASAAGLVVGDLITGVNGRKAADIPLYELREEFKRAAGTKLALSVTDHGRMKLVTISLADQV